jgi:putative transposase
MIRSLRHLLGWIISTFTSRQDLILENLALRQQLLALHTKRPRRRLTALHKLFWVVLRRLWSGWRGPLILVTPRTVVGWHRAGFRLYWTWVSRFGGVGGRRRASKEVCALIFRMAAENPTWGAPRIHAHVSHPVLLLRDRPRPANNSAFQRNPKSQRLWIVQQLREVWPYVPAHRFLLFDHDSKFGTDVISPVRDLGSHPTRTAFRSPWQNGVAERWVGSCRRDLLNHVIVLNEQHLSLRSSDLSSISEFTIA